MRRRVIAILAVTVPCSGLIAAEGSATRTPEACRALRGDAERLACYDGLFGAPEDALIEPAPSPVATTTVTDTPSLLDQRWELSPEQKRGTFRVAPYKPIYILGAFHSSNPNETPSSPAPDHTVTTPLDIRSTEVKFQFSLKSKLWENVIGNYSDLWFGYTQASHWQLYNAEESRPFRETDYEPELILNFRTHYSVFGWTGRMAGVSLTHVSNGRNVPLSRSWNRVIAQVGFDRPGWTVLFRPWWRLHESPSDDDNPDIEDFIGRGEILVTRNWRDHEVSAQLRHTFRDGDRSRGSIELNWAFPIKGRLKGYLQYFNGYGESLIDYNHTANYIGLGVSLIDWYSASPAMTRD